LLHNRSNNNMTRAELTKYIRLGKMGDSLYLIVPRAYARAHNLNPKDDVLWQPEPDGIKLKFPTTQDADAAA
jgi:hypothetical protein